MFIKKLFVNAKSRISTLLTGIKTRLGRLKAWVMRHKLLTFAAVALGLAVVIAGAYLFKRTPAGAAVVAAFHSLHRRLTGWFKGRANVVIVATTAGASEVKVPVEPSVNGK